MKPPIRAASVLSDLHDSYATRDHLGAALDDAAMRFLLVVGLALIAVFGGCMLGSGGPAGRAESAIRDVRLPGRHVVRRMRPVHVRRLRAPLRRVG